jgi:hypothetical protein
MEKKSYVTPSFDLEMCKTWWTEYQDCHTYKIYCMSLSHISLGRLTLFQQIRICTTPNEILIWLIWKFRPNTCLQVISTWYSEMLHTCTIIHECIFVLLTGYILTTASNTLCTQPVLSPCALIKYCNCQVTISQWHWECSNIMRVLELKVLHFANFGAELSVISDRNWVLVM